MKRPSHKAEVARRILRPLLAAAYLFAGYMHVTHPAPFLGITPDWVPYPAQVILVTGLCEIAGAIGLLVPRVRRLAGIMLALYAVCVFPANIKHAIDYARFGTGGLGWWYHGPRMPMQLVFIWWALFAGGVTSWPFAPRSVHPPSRS